MHMAHKASSSLTWQGRLSTLMALALISSAACASILLSDRIAYCARLGLSLCARVIIPSVFPFIIVADLLCVSVDFSSLRLLSFAFKRFFSQSEEGLSAFILGILCGFPIGVKRAAELYREGKITRREAEHLIGFSNNPSPSFVIAGIGTALLGDTHEGIALYLCTLLCAIITGVLFRGKGCSDDTQKAQSRGIASQGFSLTEAISSAGIDTVCVCSFIIFFSCVCGALRELSLPAFIYLPAVSALEVGNASSIISKSGLCDLYRLPLLGFSVGFSGLSVHLQANAMILGTDLRLKKYYFMKLCQGALCAILMLIFAALRIRF